MNFKNYFTFDFILSYVVHQFSKKKLKADEDVKTMVAIIKRTHIYNGEEFQNQNDAGCLAEFCIEKKL